MKQHNRELLRKSDEELNGYLDAMFAALPKNNEPVDRNRFLLIMHLELAISNVQIELLRREINELRNKQEGKREEDNGN